MPRLVNLGSLCIDNVYRVPSIAGAGETLASDSVAVFPGGKGLNQSLAAARAGASVTHAGCIGDDGEWLRDLLAEAGVDVAAIRGVDTASGHAVIQVNAAGENAIVIAGGANRCIEAVDIDRALDGMTERDWLLLQNEINDLPAVLERAAERSINVAFNIAPVDGREAGYELERVRLLIVNEIEAAAVAGVPVTSPPAAILEQLRQALPSTDVVLTLGKDGVHFASGESRLFVPAFEVEAVDETGAGDTFIGYLMAGLLREEPVERTLVAASAAGALSVTVPGAASSIPRAIDVARLVESRSG